MKNARKQNRNNAKGQAIAEFPAIMVVMIFFLLYPLLDLANIGLRAGFVFAGSKFAAKRASVSPAFTQDSRLGTTVYRSAIEAARESAFDFLKRVDGVKFDKSTVKTSILAVNHNGTTQEFETKLDRPADTVNNQYYIKVTVKAAVKPIIVLPMCNNVPGLGADIPLTVCAQQFAENPRGLHI